MNTAEQNKYSSVFGGSTILSRSQGVLEPSTPPSAGYVPLPVQALVSSRSISVMTGSMVDDFMTAAPTMCMSGVEDYMTAAPTTIGDLESSVPTLVRDRVANTEDFEDSDTAAEDDTELVFESESRSEESSSDSDSSEGYPAGPLLPPYRLSQVVRVEWRFVAPLCCFRVLLWRGVAVCRSTVAWSGCFSLPSAVSECRCVCAS